MKCLPRNRLPHHQHILMRGLPFTFAMWGLRGFWLHLSRRIRHVAIPSREKRLVAVTTLDGCLSFTSRPEIYFPGIVIFMPAVWADDRRLVNVFHHGFLSSCFNIIISPSQCRARAERAASPLPACTLCRIPASEYPPATSSAGPGMSV